MKNPRYSFIVPIFNAEKYICRCLNSITSQTFKNYEVILVNDGSYDSTLKILNDYKQTYSHISIRIFTQINSGAGAARNYGLKNAIGDYIVFLDSDDYVDNNYLECIDNKIEEFNADVVFVDLLRESPEGKLIRMEPMSRFERLNKDSMIRAQLTGKMPWGGVRKVVRSSIIRNNNLEYAPIKVGEESIFSFRILEEADIIVFQPKAIYHYVDTGTSLTSKDDVSNSLTVFNYIYSYLKDHGKLEKYQNTVRAMAITTAAVILNLHSKQPLSQKLLLDTKYELSKLTPYFKGDIDKKSLERRVRVCLPFIRYKWIALLMFVLSIKHKLFNSNY